VEPETFSTNVPVKPSLMALNDIHKINRIFPVIVRYLSRIITSGRNLKKLLD